jgi:hypothetical protein
MGGHMPKRIRYKELTPDLVAETAWNHLTESNKIEEMKTRYAEEMTKLPSNVSARNRYQAGVMAWTMSMRRSEIKSAIRGAVKQAKDIKDQIVESIKEEVKKKLAVVR